MATEINSVYLVRGLQCCFTHMQCYYDKQRIWKLHVNVQNFSSNIYFVRNVSILTSEISSSPAAL